jgi:hypothetical protein
MSAHAPLHCGNHVSTPFPVLARRSKELRRRCFARFCNLIKRIGACYIYQDIEDICKERVCRRVGKEGEERQKQRGLVIDTTIVRGYIVIVQEQSLLY